MMKKFDEWVKMRDKKLYEDITQDEFGDENSDKNLGEEIKILPSDKSTECPNLLNLKESSSPNNLVSFQNELVILQFIKS